MRITRININLVDEGNLVAFVTIALDHELKIRKIRVIRNADGALFVAMPSIFNKSIGEFQDVVFPMNDGFREQLTREVLGRLEQVKSGHGRTIDSGSFAEGQRATGRIAPEAGRSLGT